MQNTRPDPDLWFRFYDKKGLFLEFVFGFGDFSDDSLPKDGSVERKRKRRADRLAPTAKATAKAVGQCFIMCGGVFSNG